jgi:hypothetical protein
MVKLGLSNTLWIAVIRIILVPSRAAKQGEAWRSVFVDCNPYLQIAICICRWQSVSADGNLYLRGGVECSVKVIKMRPDLTLIWRVSNAALY